MIKDRFFFLAATNTRMQLPVLSPAHEAQLVLPVALRRITGSRTAQNLADAFKAENGCTIGVNCHSAADVTPPSRAVIQPGKPVTGDFVIPAPRADARAIGIDRAGARRFSLALRGSRERTLRENNPLVQQLSVQPSEVQATPTHCPARWPSDQEHSLSGVFFMSNFPALIRFRSIEPGLAGHTAPGGSE